MINKIIIDADGAVFGRLCSYAAKQALEGAEVVVVNSDKVLITGNRKDIIDKFKKARARGGHAQKGPYRPKVPYMMLKRSIRGMLPDYRWGEGRAAFLRIKCYNGVPTEFESSKKIKIPGPYKNKFVSLKEISQRI